MGKGWRHILLALGLAAVSACAPTGGWNEAPPDCGDVDSASFVEDLATWSRGGAEGWKSGAVRGEGEGVDPRALTEEDGLPVLHLYMAGSLPDDDGYRPAKLVYRGQCQVVETRYRGDTSLRFPKRSLTVDFKDGRTFDEPTQAGGFLGRHKLVLISPFNDNSYLRARLAFELWNRMSPEHLQMKAFSAVVYVNGEYHGLFTVSDHVNGHFLSAQGMDPGGDLFKAVGGDANFSRIDAEGSPKVKLRQGYEKKVGYPEDGDEAFRTIDALTAFVADSSEETFVAERDAWMDPRDYEDWWILSQLGYTADSVAKNAYHYRPRGPGARFRFIPWDLDASFGQNWNTLRLNVDELEPFTSRNLLFKRMVETPAIAGPMRERFRGLLEGPLHRDVVLGLIDGYHRELRAAALKDEARWGEQHRTFPRWSGRTDMNDYEGEVAYLRSWVDARWRLLEEELR
ncbi:CotH kinase family protein [Pyxidicoccus xibeiensis]|uniref:CotH kinase family protein n=1 Tax=Pyxidicoccus xibeiensis TaxID=2906759 RepID=UPI0020A6E11C|nr:CotH kinase family protein [Pyxidicoccus xibeiensis]MCP3137126.1 CotH kinase family protein [Pyxidicoccus xibeiensis]